MPNSSKRTRNARGRFSAAKPIDVTSDAQIPMFESMLVRGPSTFVLVYADWCGHCQQYKPMWETLATTPGRVANMAAVRDDMFRKIPKIADAKIQGYPSVIKVSPNGSIEKYNVNGESTNAIDSSKMRNMDAMRKEITTLPRSFMASNMATVGKPTRASNKNMDVENLTGKLESMDIYTPVSSTGTPTSGRPGFRKGVYEAVPGALLTPEDRADNALPQSGGGLSIAAAFAGAVQSVGPAALLLAAHALLPKRARTYKSPKRSSHRGGTRRSRRA